MPADLNAVITRRIDVARGLWIIYVAPEGWALSPFEAGQYTTLGLPGTLPRCREAAPEPPLKDPSKIIKRAYSIASSPNERGHIEFYLVLVEAGVLTPRLFDCGPGAGVWLGKKITGTFVLSRTPRDAHLVLVATGTGIAPYISMLRTHLRPDTERFVSVFHGVRHSRDLAYREELLSMERLCKRFSYFPVVSRPAQEPVPWAAMTGHVQDLWKSRLLERRWGFHPSPADTHIYLCGSPAMIDDMIALLNREGFAEHKARRPGQVHVERYW